MPLTLRYGNAGLAVCLGQLYLSGVCKQPSHCPKRFHHTCIKGRHSQKSLLYIGLISY